MLKPNQGVILEVNKKNGKCNTVHTCSYYFILGKGIKYTFKKHTWNAEKKYVNSSALMCSSELSDMIEGENKNDSSKILRRIFYQNESERKDIADDC